MADSSRHIEPRLPTGGPQSVSVTEVTETGAAQVLSFTGGSPGYQTKTITSVTETGSAEALVVTSGVLVHVCERRGGVYPAGGLTNQGANFATGVSTWENSRMKHVAHADSHSLKLLFVNGASDCTTTGVGTITVRAGLEGPTGTVEAVNFSGADHVDLAAGASVLSDVLSMTLTAGDTFWVRTNAFMTLGVKLPLIGLSDSPTGEGKNNGTGANSNLAWAGTISASGSKNFSAEAILGNADTPCVAVLGDSIEVGVTVGVGTPTGGYIGLALSGEVPHVRMSMGGEAAYQFLLDKSERQAVIDAIDFTDVLVGYIANDIRDSRTSTQIKADLTTIYGLFPDANVWGLTKPPYSTSSSDGWTTVANQTPDTTKDTKRQTVNDWIRAGADGGLHGFFDAAATVEEVSDPRVWAAPGGVALTFDGIHPTSAGHVLMAAALTPSVFGDPTDQTATVTEATELGEVIALSHTSAGVQNVVISPVTESGAATSLFVSQAHLMVLVEATETGEAQALFQIHNKTLTPVTETGAAQALTYTGSGGGGVGLEQMISQLGAEKKIDEPRVYTLP